MSISSGKLKHLKALSNKDGIIAAAAMDQRGSLQKSLASAKGVDAKSITPEMMSEFKTIVTKVLTPHATAILLDPEFGLPAAKARASNAGLLLAYEESGYDNTKPGRLPDLLPHVSVKRIVDWGADAVKILIYYSPFDEPGVNDIKHAFIERIGAECEFHQIPFFLEFVGYDPKGGNEKGLEYAKIKPKVVIGAMKEFSKPQYQVDVLKVEVPVNAEFVEGSSVYKGEKAYTRAEALDALPRSRRGGDEAVHLPERRRRQRAVRREPEHGQGGRHGFLGRAVRARDLERRHADLRDQGREGAGGLAVGSGRQEHQRGERGAAWRDAVDQEDSASRRKVRRCLRKAPA